MSKIRFRCDTAFEDCYRVWQDSQSNDWAWCRVQVRAEFWGFTGESSWLGGCSYASEEDFRSSKFKITHADGTVTHSGYFDDLCEEAYQDMKEQIDSACGGSDPETDVDHARAALQALYELLLDQRGFLHA